MIPKSALLPILISQPQLSYTIAEVITERQHLLNLNQVLVLGQESVMVCETQRQKVTCFRSVRILISARKQQTTYQSASIISSKWTKFFASTIA